MDALVAVAPPPAGHRQRVDRPPAPHRPARPALPQGESSPTPARWSPPASCPSSARPRLPRVDGRPARTQPPPAGARPSPTGSPVPTIPLTARVMVNRLWQRPLRPGDRRHARRLRDARRLAVAPRTAGLARDRVRRPKGWGLKATHRLRWSRARLIASRARASARRSSKPTPTTSCSPGCPAEEARRRGRPGCPARRLRPSSTRESAAPASSPTYRPGVDTHYNGSWKRLRLRRPPTGTAGASTSSSKPQPQGTRSSTPSTSPTRT